MQPIEPLRNGAAGTGGWFRVGLLSATVMTPLIARWTSIRANERAQQARSQANQRFNDVRSWLTPRASASVAAVRQVVPVAQNTWNRTLPIAQDAWTRAAPVTQQVLNRVAPVTRDAARLVAPKVQQVGKQVASKTKTVSRNSRTSTTLWLLGVGVGLTAAGVGAYILLRRRLANSAEEEPLVELPVRPVTGNGSRAKSSAQNGHIDAHSANGAQEYSVNANTPTPTQAPASNHFTADEINPPSHGELTPMESALANAAEMERAEDQAGSDFGVENSAEALFVGNIHTMVYHEIDGDNLPAEENRVYFASEAEAETSGFHRDRHEVAPGNETSQSPTA